jgi:MATH domain
MNVSTLGNPTVLSPVETLRFKIYGFGKLEQSQGDYVKLPSLLAHGCHWTLLVFPRGKPAVEEDDDEYMSIYLKLDSVDLTFDANFTVRVGSITRSEESLTFNSKDATNTWGWDKFVKRQRLFDKTNQLLDDCGTLVIEVEVQVYIEKSLVWYPPMPIRNDDSKVLADLLLDDPATSCSDVTFKVGHQEF